MRSMDTPPISPNHKNWFLPTALPVSFCAALAIAGCGNGQRNFPALSHPSRGTGEQTFQLRVDPRQGVGDHKLTLGVNLDCDQSQSRNVQVVVEDSTLGMATYICDTPEFDTVVLKPGDELYNASTITIDVTTPTPTVHWAVNATESIK